MKLIVLWIVCSLLLCLNLPLPHIKEVTTNDSPVMYLTFDDGPNDFTVEILEILNEYQIKATFFVTGSRLDCLGYIKDAYLQGHSIGIHCFRHDYDIIYASKEAYLSDLNQMDQLLKEIGIKTKLLRFPGGSSNRVSQVEMRELIEEIEQLGFQYYDWNGENGDAKQDFSLASVLSASQMGVDGKRDIMMLCHEKAITVEVLETMIEYYLELGYIFMPITSTSPTFHHLR